MLKRLLVLAFICIAMLLLLGLMVSNGAELASPPQIPPIQAACAPAPTLPVPRVETAQPALFCLPEVRLIFTPNGFCCDRNGLPVCASAYYSANYVSFHFSDRAG